MSPQSAGWETVDCLVKRVWGCIGVAVDEGMFDREGMTSGYSTDQAIAFVGRRGSQDEMV